MEDDAAGSMVAGIEKTNVPAVTPHDNAIKNKSAAALRQSSEAKKHVGEIMAR
jgi:hypothetical protein